MTDVAAVVEEIDVELRRLGTPERAEKERAYLKSDLAHYGASVPAIRGVAEATRKAHPDLTHDELTALAEVMWAEPVHERRMVTVELFDQFVDLLGVADADLLERLLGEARTWAIVDGLAASVVGTLVARDPEWGGVLDRWAAHDDFWLRRAALLALLVPLRKGGGDFERFGRYADAMLDETEFFIRKAIGWVLRDSARKRPDMVYEWLLPRAARASGVTIREAVKPLSDAQRRQILAVR